MHISTELTDPFDLSYTVMSHGWFKLPPFHWRRSTQSLLWRARVANETIEIEVNQPDSTSLLIRIDGSQSAATLEAVKHVVERVLMLDVQPLLALPIARSLDTSIANLLDQGAGRFLRGSSAFEDAIKTVLTINTSWKNTVSMVERILKNFSGDGTFPSPQRIASLSPEDLTSNCGVGYRVKTILTIANIAAEKSLETLSFNELVSIRGIGPYAAHHISVLQGEFSNIPIDSEVLKYCRSQSFFSEDASPNAIREYYSSWGEFAFLGYKVGRISRLENWIGD